jgi:hypothetical protein
MPRLNVRETSRFAAATAVLVLAGYVGTALSDAEAAVRPNRNRVTEYAVKFVCGRIEPGESKLSFAGGVFATAVNVHNPNLKVTFDRKMAIARPGAPGEVSGFVSATLDNDQAMEFGCPEILGHPKVPPEAFLTGFLVIHAPAELDVVAVYTAGTLDNGQVTTLHTERVPPRTVNLPSQKGGKSK